MTQGHLCKQGRAGQGRAVELTWAGHALSALDEVVLKALVSTHLPCR